eukprot:gene2389-2693_t
MARPSTAQPSFLGSVAPNPQRWVTSAAGCTKNGAVPNEEIQDLNDDVAIHFALQAATADKLHLVFTDPAGRFFPSEGLHGRAAPCSRSQDCSASLTPDVCAAS